jgi:hypothetical protein
VESWEDIADENPPADASRGPQTAETRLQDPAAGKIASESSPESKVIAEKAEAKLAPPETAAVTSSPSSNGSTTTSSTSSSSSKKQPSPNLTKSSKGDSSKASSLSQPPQRSEDDKENLNVVFIGHVGKGVWLLSRERANDQLWCQIHKLKQLMSLFS